MDFSYLLELAKSNDENNKQEAGISRFSTKVSRAKKEVRPGPRTAAVKAVLDKISEDKIKENEEAKKKKANLLALRAQDRKSHQRVKAMLTRNKGASKSVLEDAKDISTAKGEEQCDEDDYGYESNMSQQIFSKLANQYANAPEDDKLKFVKNSRQSSIADIKSRVINTLKKVEEEETGPRKRKRKHKVDGEDNFINDGDEYDPTPRHYEKDSSSSHKIVNVNLTNYKSDKHKNFKYEQENTEKHKEKPKKHKAKVQSGPPPMSFEELLRVAQKKHKEAPIPLLKEETKVKEKDKDKKKEADRPLTAKEKEELEDERRRKLRRLGKLPPEKKPQDPTPSPSDKQKKNDEKVAKKTDNNSKLKKALEAPKPPEPKTVDRSKYFAIPTVQKPQEPSHPPPTPSRDSKPPQASRPPPPRPPPPGPPSVPKRDPPPKNLKPQFSRSPKDVRPSKPVQPPAKSKARQFPPPDVRRRPPPPKAPAKRRIESDSEDEYDSDMDGFIDDGEDEIDFSSEIKRMFGYDRNKYQDEDDDVDDMEASFSQLQKEERISAKIGLQEDLEDMRREEEEKRLKKIRLKQMRKSR